MPIRKDIRILLCADTHLGFDQPVRTRVERRRRGPDFFANFQRVLAAALERKVDLLVHGGDLFFRSRVAGSIVDRAYRMLVEFAEHGIPLLLVPGNHERSALPPSLFLSHPNIQVFTRPETKLFEFAGSRVACAGFPCVRDDIRAKFPALLSATGWMDAEADARFLCLHQAIEGARVGPANFTFLAGAGVIRLADLPSEFDAILAGHIHRSQTLSRRFPDGKRMPVIYPGSIERTSFAEKGEPKGYIELTIGAAIGRERPQLEWKFIALPARPMEDIAIGPEITPANVRSFLQTRLARLHPDSIVRLSCETTVTGDVRGMVSAEFLRRICPRSMNVQLGAGFVPAASRFHAAGAGRRSDFIAGAGRRSALIRLATASVPAASGVYFLKGANDEILYIGKARVLRQRLLSHLRAQHPDDLPRHSRLLHEVQSFDYELIPSELLALLREDELIKEHRPRYNVRQNDFSEYHYLELTAERLPRLRIIAHQDGFDDCRVFGPYHDRYRAEDLLQLIHHHVGLRSCSEPNPTAPCLEFDLGHCAAPCRDSGLPHEYDQAVQRAIPFLEGDVFFVVKQLESAMACAARRLEYEKAQHFKQRIEFCRRFGERQRFINDFRKCELTVTENQSGRVHVFRNGRLVSGGRVPECIRCDDPRFLLDRANIVSAWLRRHSGECSHQFGDLTI